MKKATVVLAALVITACTLASAGAADLKIGYVDLQKALNESTVGKKAKEKFTVEVKNAESEITRKKEELERLGGSLEKQGSMLKDDVKAEKEKEFIKMQKDYERKVKDYKDELQIKDAQLTRGILSDLVEIIKKYGKENNYTIVFERSETVLLYATDGLDITEKIISLYDAQSPSKKK
jgi:outer membrane protein